MKKHIVYLLTVMLLLLSSCANNKENPAVQVITPEQVVAAMNENENIQLIDVRTPQEFLEGHLKNAQNICVTSDDFEERVKQLDKDKPVYLYCRSGGRSANAAQILEEMGFTEVYDLQGGITNWKDKGLEVEK